MNKSKLQKLVREELNNIREEQNLPEEELKAALRKAGVKGSATVKFINKDTKSSPKTINFDGTSFSDTSVNEGVAKTIVMCTMLAGVVSCTKPGGGYGYNVSVKGTTHDLQKDDRTKEITIVTPDGEETNMINPSDTARFTWSSHGIYVGEKPTPEELQIAAFGALVRREQNSNNGRGYDAKRYKIDAVTSKIQANPGYTDGSSGSPAPSIHDHEDYKVGRVAKDKYTKSWNEFKAANPVENFEDDKINTGVFENKTKEPINEVKRMQQLAGLK
jgi:hypothetical protein